MWMIVLMTVLAGVGAIAAALLIQIVSRSTGILRVATPWPEAAQAQNLQPGHVVPRDALDAYDEIPVGSMSASGPNFANVFEIVDPRRVAIFASYEHPAVDPHPSRSCVVGFCRVPRGGPGTWIIGRRSLDGPHIGRGTFQVPVAGNADPVAVRVLRDEMEQQVISTVRLCFDVFSDIGFPYDVILCNGWLIIPGPRPMYDDLQKYDLAKFVERTLDLAQRLNQGIRSTPPEPR